jgi:hypothetical protein
VEQFWLYADKTGAGTKEGLYGTEVGAILGLDAGGLVQTRANPETSRDEGFGHSLFVVDAEHLVLAQNSPANFITIPTWSMSRPAFFSRLSGRIIRFLKWRRGEFRPAACRSRPFLVRPPRILPRRLFAGLKSVSSAI